MPGHLGRELGPCQSPGCMPPWRLGLCRGFAPCLSVTLLLLQPPQPGKPKVESSALHSLPLFINVDPNLSTAPNY